MSCYSTFTLEIMLNGEADFQSLNLCAQMGGRSKMKGDDIGDVGGNDR